MTDIPVSAVQRGDLLLVTHRPCDALADLIIKLDRSPGGFSHCGLALGDGWILSSFPVFEIAHPIAFGGLREDPFEEFWTKGQDIHLVAGSETTGHAHARAWIADHTPPQGDFSIPKIVMVAAALHALDPRNPISAEASDRVVRAAVAAAAVWEDDGDYYCAEAVAEAYDWKFTLAELVPPERRELVMTPLVRLGLERATDILSMGRCDKQKILVHALVDEVLDCDPEFFDQGLRATFTSLLAAAPSWIRAAVASRKERRNIAPWSPLDRATKLPRPLVTPRMLRMRYRGDDVPPRVAMPDTVVVAPPRCNTRASM